MAGDIRRPIVVTSALPYANGPVHIGHLVEYIQTDIYVRFLKSIGKDVIYVCASDAHGTPIQVNAEKQGVAPELFVKKFNKAHARDFKDFLIKFDNFYTTHSPENKELSECFFNTLKQKGHIVKKSMEIMYCNSCNRSLPDRFVRGTCPHCATKDQYGDICENCGVALKGIDLIDPKCSICGGSPVLKESEHYFFRLAPFTEPLREWIKKNKKLQPEIKNHINEWLNKGLDDWAISRDAPYFGFNVPGEKDKYLYVWLDAPIGYVASTKNFTEEWEEYWKKDGEIIHFIGKDIIYFHFLFWPAMLMAVGYTLPSDIVVHGFLTVNGKKMSKSRGTFFTAQEFLKLYDPEYLRFYYALHLSKKLADVDLDFEDFQATMNNKLVANVANFCYRVLSFTEKNYGGKIDTIAKGAVVKELEKKVELVKQKYHAYDLKGAVAEVLAISDLGNQYFQKAEPWKDKTKGKDAVGLAANIVRVLTILLSPVLPSFSVAIQKQLGEEGLVWDDIAFDKKINVKGAKIVFTKVEKIPSQMTFPLDLRVGRVVSVEDHPDADSLYVLEVDVGGDERTIVAGLKKYIEKKYLKGKHVLVCMNIVPATIRGVKSQGMMLAADDGKRVVVVDAPKSEPGMVVEMVGYTNSTEPITFEAFTKLGLKVLGGKVSWEGTHLHTDVEDVTVTEVNDGALVR